MGNGKLKKGCKKKESEMTYISERSDYFEFGEYKDYCLYMRLHKVSNNFAKQAMSVGAIPHFASDGDAYVEDKKSVEAFSHLAEVIIDQFTMCSKEPFNVSIRISAYDSDKPYSLIEISSLDKDGNKVFDAERKAITRFSYQKAFTIQNIEEPMKKRLGVFQIKACIPRKDCLNKMTHVLLAIACMEYYSTMNHYFPQWRINYIEESEKDYNLST